MQNSQCSHFQKYKDKDLTKQRQKSHQERQQKPGVPCQPFCIIRNIRNIFQITTELQCKTVLQYKSTSMQNCTSTEISKHCIKNYPAINSKSKCDYCVKIGLLPAFRKKKIFNCQLLFTLFFVAFKFCIVSTYQLNMVLNIFGLLLLVQQYLNVIYLILISITNTSILFLYKNNYSICHHIFAAKNFQRKKQCTIFGYINLFIFFLL